MAIRTREALEELSRRLRAEGDTPETVGSRDDCSICGVSPLAAESPGGSQPELSAHADGCPVRVLLDALRLGELSDDSVALKVRRLELGTGIHGAATGPSHGERLGTLERDIRRIDRTGERGDAEEIAELLDRVEKLERIYGGLNEGMALRIDRLESGISGQLGAHLEKLDVYRDRIEALEQNRVVGEMPMYPLDAGKHLADKIDRHVVRVDTLADKVSERFVALEHGLATALGSGLLERADESRLQALEETVVGHGSAILQRATVERVDRLDTRVNGLEARVDRSYPLDAGQHNSVQLERLTDRLAELELERPEAVDEPVGFDTWAARRIDVSRRAVFRFQAMDPSHVMSPLFEKIVSMAADADRPTTRLEELQQAAEDLTFIWAALAAQTFHGRDKPISELANALYSWLKEEVDR